MSGARDAAWTNGHALWALRDEPRLCQLGHPGLPVDRAAAQRSAER